MAEPAPSLLLPDAPALVAGARQVVWLSADGEVEELDRDEARRRLRGARPPLLAHARAVARRLGGSPFLALDVLELFAFVRPARICLPTPRGLARALGLAMPADAIAEALVLRDATRLLLAELARSGDTEAAALAGGMDQAGWFWGPFARAALQSVVPAARGLAVWQRMAEISDHAPPPPAGNQPVTAEAARGRLAKLLAGNAEARPSQAEYAAAVTPAFGARDEEERPRLVLAEAGTGVGKTLGYLAPASLWAEQNQGTVWISTYTRNLQHQIDGELDRLHPEPAQKALKVVLRKGRENYLCLLNFEEAVRAVGGRAADAVPLSLMARWAARTRDGDLSGGDFPGWLPELVGRARTAGLADRRGECVFGACTHYDRCFVERSIRRARRADIVIGNHALVMAHAALNDEDPGASGPTRIVFDEGHHLFDAADSAFSWHLSGAEGLELRRWLLGAENARSRARGLKRRIEDLAEDHPAIARALTELLAAGHALPGDGWLARIGEGAPHGPVEGFLSKLRFQLITRTHPDDVDTHGLETDAMPPVPGLIEAAVAAQLALQRMVEPATRLREALAALLDDEAVELETGDRLRIERVSRSLRRWVLGPVTGWVGMLAALQRDTPAEFVDWFALERTDGREADIGMRRHFIDPTVPLAAAVIAPAQGVLVTSATLTDSTGIEALDWAAAENRTGARHLGGAGTRVGVASPFDYAAQTRVFVINDVRRDDVGQVASAYRALFEAAGGGALGLFTAIARLRAVHARIAPALEEAGLALLAQHVDGLETATLIDIFRAEEDACLLGTDAVRDGVDVPGRALRLIVFDRVPWPRPTILHRARRAELGGSAYDDLLTRLKLKQAFGRLIRRATDTGVFVLLDRQCPSRLLAAFPPGVAVKRVGLAEAIAETREFLAPAER